MTISAIGSLDDAKALWSKHLPTPTPPPEKPVLSILTNDTPIPRPDTLESEEPDPDEDGTRYPEPATGTGYRTRSTLYVDMAAAMSGPGANAPTPTACSRSDGISLFYRGSVNGLFGDPESGKTWIALAAAHEELKMPDSRVLVVDLDHNGAHAIGNRLVQLGVEPAVVQDPTRFRYTEPDDHHHLSEVVADMRGWAPTLVIVDSMGELLPLYGAKSNDADDFTRVNSQVLKPLARIGAAVVYIDHLSKGFDSRKFGAVGSGAKRRAVDGAYLRVTVAEPFAPGQGGSAHISVNKDRHGGLRARCPKPANGTEAYAGQFTLRQNGEHLTWDIRAPRDGEQVPAEDKRSGDGRTFEETVQAIRDLDPPITSLNDAHRRVGGKRATAMAAAKEVLKERGAHAA